MCWRIVRWPVFLMSIFFLCIILFPCGCRLFSRPADNMNDPFVQEIMKDAAVKEVRFKGKIWRVCMDNGTKATVGETMYVDENEWKQYVKNKATTRLRSLIVHESVHTSQQLSTGLTIWMICYFTSTKFRWEEEKVAYEAGWRVEVIAGEIYTDGDYESFANDVSGVMYYGMITHDEAYTFMKNTITKLQEEYKNK